MAPQLKLLYYNFAARGELTRLILHYAGIPFVDETITRVQLPGIKHTLPIGQIPVLEVDGVQYSQSIAMARYVAKLAGIYPTDDLQAFRVDMYVDVFLDLIPVIFDIFYAEKDEAIKAQKTSTFLGGTLPYTLGKLEGLVEGKFFLGNNVTLADVMLFDVVVNMLQTTFPGFDIEVYPKLIAIVKRVQELPGIAAYLAQKN